MNSPQPYGLVAALFELPAAGQHLLEVGRARAQDEAVRADHGDMSLGLSLIIAVLVWICLLILIIDSTQCYAVQGGLICLEKGIC